MTTTIDSLMQLLNQQGQQKQQSAQPEITQQDPTATQQPQQSSSWVQDLIAQHSQQNAPRIKRTPVGFDFKSIPFDPSSYYRALGTFKDVSRLATSVTQTEVANRDEAARQKAAAENQAAIQNALNGVNPNFTGGTYTGTPTNRNYHLKGVKSDVASAANYWGSKYSIGTIYGLGKGSVPGSDHPKGLATDFMVYNDRSKGTALANDIIANYRQWNVKYVIWYHYIWHPGRGWSRYSGPSPHTDHVHVSYNS